MKERVITVLLVIVMAVYLIMAFCHAQKEWQKGISAEEQIWEEMIIWQRGN